MLCPDCGARLVSTKTKTRTGELLEVEYCYLCGGFWLDHWEANVIPLKSARELAKKFSKVRDLGLVSGSSSCPHCSVKMQAQRGENVPLNCTVLICPQCQGNWFPKGQLVVWKKAQESKLEYLKAWKIPIVSAFSVLLPVVALVLMGLSIPLTVKLVQQRQDQRTVAQELIYNVNEYILNPHSVLIAFNTTEPVPSEVEYGTSSIFLKKVTVSVAPETFHQVTLSDLDSEDTYYYRVIVHKEGRAITMPLTAILGR